MELTQLRYFKTIAESATMTQAAETLHISQPALSAALKRLENELGLQLFKRTKNTIQLNAAGKRLLIHVNEIFQQVEHLKLEMSLLARKDKSLTIGFSDPGPQWFLVPNFSLSHNETEISHSLFEETENDAELLTNQLMDALVTAYPLDHPDINIIPLVKEQILLSIPADNPLAERKKLSVRELNQLTISTFFVGGSFFKKQEPFWQQLEPNVVLEKQSDYFLYNQMVRNTDVITISTKLAQHYRDDGENRVLVPVTDPELSVTYYLCYLKENTAKMQLFIEWCELAFSTI